MCVLCVAVLCLQKFSNMWYFVCITLNLSNNKIPSICAMKSNDKHNLLFASTRFFPSLNSIAIRIHFDYFLKALISHSESLGPESEGERVKKICTHFLLGFIINRFVILWMKPALNNSHFKNHKWAHPDKRVPAARLYTQQCECVQYCVCKFNGSPFLILKAVNEAAHTLKWHKTVRQRFCGTLKMKTKQKEIHIVRNKIE